MSKLWLIGLAASAAWTQAATAQTAPPAPPAPPMGHGAHAPMPPPGAPMMHRMMPPGGGHGMNMHRIGRGGVLPPFFMGPQFIVSDWRMFGFPAPMPGGRWVRYYDDALLVDRGGRVMDARHGWDWDRRGDRMGHDDHHDDDDDRGYDDDHDRDDEWAGDGAGRRRHGDRMVRVYRHQRGDRGDCRRSCVRVRHLPPPPPHPGYGYGYGYGCGCGGVVITETTTTTAPVVETRTYYETVYETVTERRAAPRRHYSKPVVRYSKPVVRRSVKAPPRPGERG